MELARAVVLAVPPREDRPWSSARSTPKPLVPVAGRPILFHVLDALRAAGVTRSTILAQPEQLGAFTDAVADGARWGMAVRCRPAAPGAFDARELTGPPGDGAVVVHHGDALLADGLGGPAARIEEEDVDALALMLGGDPALAGDPAQPGAYLLSARACALLRDGEVSADPLDALQRLGGRVRTQGVAGCRACHGGESSLLRANREALSRLRGAVTDATLEHTQLQGDVVVHPTASLRNTLVRGPVVIGAGARIVDSYIGPYTSIGADTELHGTEIEHSIVMDGARLMFVGHRLETCVIGRGAQIVRRFSVPSVVQMSIGDGAEVALS